MIYGFDVRDMESRGVPSTSKPRTKASDPPRAHAHHFKNNDFTEMCCGTEAGSYLRLIDSRITQIKAQGPSRTCNESKEEVRIFDAGLRVQGLVDTSVLPAHRRNYVRRHTVRNPSRLIPPATYGVTSGPP